MCVGVCSIASMAFCANIRQLTKRLMLCPDVGPDVCSAFEKLGPCFGTPVLCLEVNPAEVRSSLAQVPKPEKRPPAGSCSGAFRGT